MIFIWRGWGILVVLYALIALVVGTVIRNSIGGGVRAGVTIGLSEVVAGIAVWFTGTRLNGAGDRVLLEPNTGKEVRVRRVHSLFWIPMQYWAPVLAIGGVRLRWLKKRSIAVTAASKLAIMTIVDLMRGDGSWSRPMRPISAPKVKGTTAVPG